jgi:hypothetical protein
MIIQLALAPIFLVIGWLLFLIPAIDYTLPTSFMDSYQGLIDLLHKSSFFLPVSSIAVIFSVMVLFYSVRFVISVVNWIIGKIPTIS